MCNVSLVMDQYRPWFPNQWPNQTTPLPQSLPVPASPIVPVVDSTELRELIDSFRQAIEAAKTFDRLTGQEDCEDPEKATLVDRVAELERRLDAIGEAARPDFEAGVDEVPYA